MSEITARRSPEYLDKAVIYQLFLRPFTPAGTLKSAEKLLPHIKSIGADIVYLCPCFAADDDEDRAYWSGRQIACKLNNPKNPYRMKDYFHVDEEYGSDKDLKDFVKSAHSLGLRVIFDLVYFHCGPKAVFLDEHPDFVRRNPDGSPVLGEWRFPQLNYENPELCEYMWSNMEYFVREFDVDGYRCDVADNVPLFFWEEGRRRIDRLKPDLMMLNEGFAPEMQREAFDLNYDFFFKDNLMKVLQKGAPAAHIREYRDEYERVHLAKGGRSILCFDNHDFANGVDITRFEKDPGSEAVELLLFLIHTMRGVPFIYNGYEVGDANNHCIWGNRFHGANLTIEWERALTEKGQARLEYVKTLTAFHKSEPAIYSGDMKWFDTLDSRVLGYERSCEGQTLRFLLNMSRDTLELEGIKFDSFGCAALENGAIKLAHRAEKL